MNIQQSITVRGKDRYKSGVMEYKRMGYWEPNYEPKDTDVIALFRARRRTASFRPKPARRWRANPRPRAKSTTAGDSSP